MQFIYRIQPNRTDMLESGPTDDEAKILEEHYLYLKNLTDKRIVHIAGRTLITNKDAFGIVVLETNSEEEAVQIMKNDPAVLKKIMCSELYPFKISLSKNTPIGH